MDTGNSHIRTVIASGVIQTIAGSIFPGYSGDGGQATSAELNRPTGCVVDATGRVLISDTNNNRVRVITGTIITTLAGTGQAGFSGDGGPPTAARINLAEGIATDALRTTFYLADTANNRVRRIAGNVITTIVGNGQAGNTGDGGAATAAELNGPTGVALWNGTLYVADNLNNRVRAVSPTGTIVAFAGTGGAGFGGDGGPPTAAQLNDPIGVSVDADGSVYIGDTDNERIRVVIGAPGPSDTPSPSRTATPTRTPLPNNSSARVVSTLAGTGQQGNGGDGGPATAAQLFYPFLAAPTNGTGVTVNGTGDAVLVVDSYNHEVRAVSAWGASCEWGCNVLLSQLTSRGN